MLYRLFTLLILLLSAPAWGASYYVDCNAAPDGDGSLSTPWDAVADVNGASFNAGDNVYFAKGCTWREQLIIPSSGSSGSPITFGAYGSGDDPFLNGADTITTWIAEAGATNLHSNPEAVNAWGVSGDVTVGQNVAAASSPDSTTTADSVIPAANANPHIVADYIAGTPATQYTLTLHAKSADVNKPWAVLQVKFLDSGFADLGSSATTFFSLYDSTVGTTAGATTNYNLPSRENYRRLGITVTSPASTAYVVFYYLCAEADNDVTFAGDAATAHSYLWGAKMEVGAAPTVYGTSYYAGSITTENKTLYQGTTQLINFADKASLCAGSFWYDAPNDRIYAKATNLADPDTHTMTAGQRDYSIAIVDKNYITIENIEVGGGNSYPIYVTSSGGNVAGILLDGVTSSYGSDGLMINKVTGAIVKNCNISNTTPTTSWTGGINIANSTATLSDNIVHDGYTNGIVLAGNSTATLNRDRAYNMGYGQYYAKCGFSVVNTNTVTFNNCVTYHNTDDGFTTNSDSVATYNGCLSYENGNEWLSPVNYSGDGFTAHDTAVVHLNYCIAYGNHKSGAGFVNTGAGNTIYGCTFYNNYNTALDRGTTPFYKNNGIILHGASGDWTVKNNITAHNGTEIYITAEAVAGSTTFDIDYNLYYDSRGGSAFNYDGTDYSFADWKTASSQDAHSLTSDPLLNTITWQIAGNSPAKDTGAVLYTYAAHPGDYYGRKIYGSGPDIGAIEFEDVSPGSWFFEFFSPPILNLCASTNAACYIQP